MSSTFLISLQPNRAPPPGIGAKARQLHLLMRRQLPVPPTYVCTWSAHEAFRRHGEPVLQALAEELASVLKPSTRYAVRSSAELEDHPHHSFAGQFDSVLDVQGIPALLQAVTRVWASAESPAAQTYLAQRGQDGTAVKMGVIIQEMVPSVAAGVAFSRNPLTGLDEVVVEAVPGSGAALVQEGVTPARWVYKWGAWLDRPETAPLPQAVIETVVQQTQALETATGRPVDVEWVYDGQAVHWVQLRPVTALDGLNVYSNRISREVLPGLIKPMVWSINVPLVNSAWIALFTELIGPHDIKPAALSRAFCYRAYFNMGTIGRVFALLGLPRESLELLMGMEGGAQRPRFRPTGRTWRLLPRMLRFGLGKLRYGRRLEALLPELDRAFAAHAASAPAQMDPARLLAEMDALIDTCRRAAYANIVTPLLMQLYHRLLRGRLQRHGIPLEQLALRDETAAATDPGPHLDRLQAMFHALPPAVQQQVRATPAAATAGAAGAGYAAFRQLENIDAFQAAVAGFLQQFGHLSDSGNDISRVPWRENPDLVLTMIVDRPPPAGAENGDPARLAWEALSLSPLTRWQWGWLYRRARQFQQLRERVSFQYTYGYGLLRNYVLALGAWLVHRQLVDRPDDIFYLYLDEVRDLVAGHKDGSAPADRVARRRQELAACRQAVLPEIIYGDEAPPPVPQAGRLSRLAGIPTSRGYYQGPVRVIHSVSEIDRMVPGAVLVIPYSDVSWTPLFARAGAVIAESGGILSHSSIVAREYRLPAVVSVDGACRLLQDDMMVTVDGFRGEILLPADGDA